MEIPEKVSKVKGARPNKLLSGWIAINSREAVRWRQNTDIDHRDQWCDIEADVTRKRKGQGPMQVKGLMKVKGPQRCGVSIDLSILY